MIRSSLIYLAVNINFDTPFAPINPKQRRSAFSYHIYSQRYMKIFLILQIITDGIIFFPNFCISFPFNFIHELLIWSINSTNLYRNTLFNHAHVSFSSWNRTQIPRLAHRSQSHHFEITYDSAKWSCTARIDVYIPGVWHFKPRSRASFLRDVVRPFT